MSDTEVLDSPTDTPAAPSSPSAGRGKSRKGNMPIYHLAKVDGGSLPDNPRAGRSKLYFDLLEAVASDPGEWYEIAYFKTPNGAKQALKALSSGDREIPEGEWEFEVRRVANPDGQPRSPKNSKLFARLVG